MVAFLACNGQRFCGTATSRKGLRAAIGPSEHGMYDRFMHVVVNKQDKRASAVAGVRLLRATGDGTSGPASRSHLPRIAHLRS